MAERGIVMDLAPPSESYGERGTLWLLGGGGHAAVVAEAARAAGWIVDGFFDDAGDTTPGTIADLGLGHLGPIEAAPEALNRADENTFVHAATGDNDLRQQWCQLFDHHLLANVIHPSAVVSPSAKVSFQNVYIGANAVINARAAIYNGVIINTGAIIEHDCEVRAFAHVAPSAVLAGGAQVGDRSLIGARAVVINGIHLAPDVILGAGAVAVHNLPAHCTAVGVPARVQVPADAAHTTRV